MAAGKRAATARTRKQAGARSDGERTLDVEFTQDPPEALTSWPVAELYFATVRAIGTPINEAAVKPLEQTLRQCNFDLTPIKLSDYLLRADDASTPLGLPQGAYGRYHALMSAGDRYRERRKRGDALLIEALAALHDNGRSEGRNVAAQPPEQLGVAYLFRNLMHPDEVKRLRLLYDRQLFIISVFSPEERRKMHLADVLAGGNQAKSESMTTAAEELIKRDSMRDSAFRRLRAERLESKKYLVNIESTFHLGDLFVDATDPHRAAEEVERFVKLIFRHPFITPTIHEIGMVDAYNAKLESGNLARQVGAAICTPDGELLVTGTNDVPRPGGGVYRAGHEPDYRDYNKAEWGYDSSDRWRRDIVEDFVNNLLRDPSWVADLELPDGEAAARFIEALNSLKESKQENAGDLYSGEPEKDFGSQVVDRIIESDVIWSSQLFDVIEYGRTMHAEMDAITSAARKGVSIKGCTLYCTTLPCHECARLIIGAGISRVIFIEPYEKSRTSVLYRTEVNFTTLDRSFKQPSGLVDFIPYVGVAPRRFQELFFWVDRKEDDVDNRRTLKGEVTDWEVRQEQLGKQAAQFQQEFREHQRIHRAPALVRESIMSPSALLSLAHFLDIYAHESQVLEDFFNPGDDGE
jgi:cytidine deaminase